MKRALWRLVAFSTCFVLSGTGVNAAAGFALAWSGLPPVDTGVGKMPAVKAWRQGVEGDRRHETVALLGDSKLMAAATWDAVPFFVQKALRRRGHAAAHMAIHALPWAGLAVAGEYSLADEVIRARPDRIVLELNLNQWGPSPPGPTAFPELAGFVHLSRLWEAMWLPLSYSGITFDRLLFYRLLVSTGAIDPWASLTERQARVFKLREPLETRLEGVRAPEMRGMPRWHWDLEFARLRYWVSDGKSRAPKEHVLADVGNLLNGIDPEHPRLRVLKALLEDYRRSGIPVLVWTTPLNVEHFEAVGCRTVGLEQSIATFREIVESRGATFVTFHRRLRDEAFLDANDHFTTTGKQSAARLLGTELGDAIARWESSLHR